MLGSSPVTNCRLLEVFGAGRSQAVLAALGTERRLKKATGLTVSSDAQAQHKPATAMALAANNTKNLQTADKVIGQHVGAWLLRQETRAAVLLDPRKPIAYCRLAILAHSLRAVGPAKSKQNVLH